MAMTPSFCPPKNEFMSYQTYYSIPSVVGDVMTALLITVLGWRNHHFTHSETAGIKGWKTGRCSLIVLSAFGVCISSCGLLMLLRKTCEGDMTLYVDWIHNGSEAGAWMTILLTLSCQSWNHLPCGFLYIWWIAKAAMDLPHLYAKFCLLEVLFAWKEVVSFLIFLMFGTFLYITEMKERSGRRKNGSLEDPLLPHGEDLGEEQKKVPDGKKFSYWELLFFKFVNPIMHCGSARQLEYEDLIQLPDDLNPSACLDALSKCWVAEERKSFSEASIFKAICGAYGWPYLRLGLLKVVNDSAAFLGPLLLNKMIKFLQEGSAQLDGFALAFALGLSFACKSVLDTQYSFYLAKLKLKLRASIMGIVYQKCLSITLAERSNFSEGEIQTLMSIDADRAVNLCNSFHDLWSLPLQIGIALFLLYTQVKVAFLSGFALTVLLIPVNRYISGLIADATKHMMKQKDERIRRIVELLAYFRTLKMYAWELYFGKRILQARESEMNYLSTRKYLDAWCVFFWATTPTLFSLSTFGLFTLLGHSLDAATVFTCVALFNTLISPLNSFPWVINGLIDAMISCRRLSKFLCSSNMYTQEMKPELGNPEKASSLHDNAQSAGEVKQPRGSSAIVVDGASCSWSSSDKNIEKAILRDITLKIPHGYFVVVLGEVGSGKSSLLNLILGETQLLNGSVCCHGTMAYVPQSPWILSGTVRDNIMFGNYYDPESYEKTVQSCALHVDLASMGGGDHAFTGERGAQLSGGQRARLALARAIYHNADMYLLDDVLSAVDAQVSNWILQHAILGPMMNKKTRILCTHNIQAVLSADLVIIMDRGHIKWSGAPSIFLTSSSSSQYLSKDLSQVLVQQVTGDNLGIQQLSDEESGSDLKSLEAINETIEEEQRVVGRVEFSVYMTYLKFSGWPVAVLIGLSAFLMQVSRNGNDLWLSHWVDTSRHDSAFASSTYFNLGVLCIFAAVNSLLTLVRAFSFAFGGLRAAFQVHNTLVENLTNAPVNFFDQNPSGRILNRLSSDQYAIDDSLPFIFNILLANFLSLLGVAVILSYVQVSFILLLIPFWYVFCKLQSYYRCTSRELRRLDNVSRSPIYASFTETLDGSSTIRAFKVEAQFMSQFNGFVSLYQKTSYSEAAASFWLSLRLQMLAALTISFIAVMAVLGHQGGLPFYSGSPGLVGLALSYAAPVVSLLSGFLSSFTETEKEMVSVERVIQYMDIPAEGLSGLSSISDWPSFGEIVFDRICLRYTPSSPPALHDVSFTISSGSQVGIVGRTGAGKSSILNALFRLNPISGGQILLDGINISTIPVRELRSVLAVVPQSPCLFEGTLRDNLDPFKMHPNSSIWDVLQKCHIKEEVEAAGGLDMVLKHAGQSFSVGQRQLICLARALLKSSKVLCLDECTANIDSHTAGVLQRTISSECSGTTVVTIAHRISTIVNMDLVFVLDNGKLVEEGNPQVLMQDHNSIFSGYAKASMM